MLDRLSIAQNVIHKTYLFANGKVYTHSQSGLAIAIVLNWELASHGKQQVSVKAKDYVYFLRITRAMDIPFSCQAIAWPLSRLAIASFYVHSL